MSTIKVKTSPANRKELAQAFGQNQSAVRRIESLTQDITITIPDALENGSQLALMMLESCVALPVSRAISAAELRIESQPIPLSSRPSQNGLLVRASLEGSVAQQPGNYDTILSAIARFASPPPIGSTAPSAGIFTTLSATQSANAPLFFTDQSAVSAPTAVATTVYSLPNTTPGTWLVNCNLGEVGDAIHYSAFAIVISDGSTARIAVQNDGSLQTITLSGLNIQSTQNSGATQTIHTTLARVA